MRYLPLCMKSAIPGPAVPDDQKPTIPPHPKCDPDWEYLPSSGNCYHFTSSERSWAAASDHCAGMNAHLTSVNSPDLQAELFSLSWFDSTALGKF